MTMFDAVIEKSLSPEVQFVSGLIDHEHYKKLKEIENYGKKLWA